MNSTNTSEDCIDIGCLYFENSTILEDSIVKQFNLFCGVVNLILSFLIIFGNLLAISTIIVFQCFHHHSYYILLSLAFADFFVGLLTCPFYVAFYLAADTLVYKRVPCLLWFSSEVFGTGASLHNLLFIAIDRLIAIRFPFFYIKWKTKKCLISTLGILWLYLIIVSCLPLMGLNKIIPNRKCTFMNSLPVFYIVWTRHVTVSLIIFISTMVYSLIFYTVYNHGERLSTSYASVPRDEQWDWRVKTAKLTSVLYLLFIMLWVPYFSIAPFRTAMPASEILQVLHNVSLIIALSTSFINPMIYAITQYDFRRAYLLLLTTPFSRWKTLNAKRLRPSVRSKCETVITTVGVEKRRRMRREKRKYNI